MAPVKHGAYINGKPDRLYRVWLTMRSRCSNPKTDGYARYGGRGIKVCERWNDFALFKQDVGEQPTSKHSLDRHPNRDGDYEPSNVRWATWEEQANNKDTVRLITLPDGREMSVSLAARACGIKRSTLSNRLLRECPQERLLDPPDPDGGRVKKGDPHRRWNRG